MAGTAEPRDAREGVPDLPGSYVRFVELFNDAQFWESHEVLETPWRENPSPFYKGLIIYASAFVHAQRAKSCGIVKQLVKAEHYLEAYAPHYMGLDVTRLLGHLRHCLAVARALGAHPSPAAGPLVPFDRLSLRPEWIRGNESELA